jgi:lipopolysaccharide/colanic/teichoic acid biosynthesis glycosyltransferase
MEARLALSPYDETTEVVAPLEQLPLREADVTLLPTPATPAIDIVVVSYNSARDLSANWETLRAAAKRASAGLIVVDNGSVDGSVDFIADRADERVRATTLGENLGFGAAVNIAAGMSGADYLVVVNPDVSIPAPDALVRMVAHLEEHPGAAAVAPRLLNPDGSTQPSARVVPTLGMMVARQTKLGATRWGRRREQRYLRLPDRHGGHQPVEWALGAALVVRRGDFDRVGGFDERFFLYFEDVDLCVRLRQAGQEVHYLPTVSLVHDHHRQSSAENGSVAKSSVRREHVKSAIRFFAKHPRFAFRRGLLDGRLANVTRRAFDIAAASLLLLAFAPLLAIVALAIKLDSRGPVFFRQRRLGRDAQPFTFLKFRTMARNPRDGHDLEVVRRHVLGDAVGLCGDRAVYKILPTEGVTAVGRVLRRLSLDELPQLWNVLRGDMSLVGFRPPTPQEVAHYPDWYYVRFTVKPGLTGLWQTSGRNEKSYAEMVEDDIEYVRRRSWRLDLMLVLRTPAAVLRGRGAY